MLKFDPIKAVLTHTIVRGEKIVLQLPSMVHKKTFVEFIRRNKQFHEPWVYVSGEPSYFDQYIRRMKSGSMLGFFIFTKESNEFVGVINLKQYPA